MVHDIYACRGLDPYQVGQWGPQGEQSWKKYASVGSAGTVVQKGDMNGSKDS